MFTSERKVYRRYFSVLSAMMVIPTRNGPVHNTWSAEVQYSTVYYISTCLVVLFMVHNLHRPSQLSKNKYVSIKS